MTDRKPNPELPLPDFDVVHDRELVYQSMPDGSIPALPVTKPPWSVSEPGADRPPPTTGIAIREKRAAHRPMWRWLLGVILLAAVGIGAYFGARTFMSSPAQHRSVRTTPLYGSLVVRSDPPGAMLFVDGRAIGPTPATLSRVRTGSHRVRLVLAGHQPHEGQVEIRAQSARTVEQALVPLGQRAQRGWLTLSTRPAARVYLDGRLLGETPLRDVPIRGGLLRLELETPDGQRRIRGVLVPDRQHTSVHLDLTRLP